jgi:hypothetical protein
MNKTYIGISVKRYPNGYIFAVTVKEQDSNNKIDLDPDTYLQRNIQPPIEDLPTKND